MKRLQFLSLFLCAVLIGSLFSSCRFFDRQDISGGSDDSVGEASVAETDPIPEETEPPLLCEKTDNLIVAPYDIPCYEQMECGFVYDPENGLLFRQGDMTESIFPASTTKLITALVALEYCEPEDEMTAGDELYLVTAGASSAYLGVGSRLTVEMLIEAELLPSGCDASYVLAAGVGKMLDPTVETSQKAVDVFVAEMNAWAERNGLINSYFRNPDGFHDPEHHSCMQDLLRVAVLSMQNETIRKYTNVFYDKVLFSGGETGEWVNTNKILNPNGSFYKKDCIGIKTGQTEEAGCCLLSCFTHDGKTVYIGTFGSATSQDRFECTVQLAETFLPGVE